MAKIVNSSYVTGRDCGGPFPGNANKKMVRGFQGVNPKDFRVTSGLTAPTW